MLWKSMRPPLPKFVWSVAQHCLALLRSVRKWVNPSKRGGTDGLFRGLAGLLKGISQGRTTREIPRSSPASLRKTLSFPTLFSQIFILFQLPKIGKVSIAYSFYKCLFGQLLLQNFKFWDNFFHKFCVEHIFIITFFWSPVEGSKTAIQDRDESWKLPGIVKEHGLKCSQLSSAVTHLSVKSKISKTFRIFSSPKGK